ncbi:MAG: MFS transporter [Prevotellaceae bacterium]|jgi:DHA3 family macrolide efflux protein-like MFS transporter|nr:MFS transporter [Prevotellaceae bacterium]
MSNTLHWKKNTGLFLAGQAISLFGSMLTQYAIMWEITLRMQSGAAMTLYALLGLLPTFLMSPLGGVWADRFNRKTIINLADGGIALVTLAVAIVFMGGYEEVWLLFACAGVRALGQGVHSPAINAFIPQITPPEHLSKINGINSSIQSLAFITSPMASAALMSFMPLAHIFFIDVVTAAIGISVVCFLVKLPKEAALPHSDAPTTRSYLHDMRNGWRYIRRRPFILQMTIICALFNIAIAPASFLSPLQVVRNFGDEVWRLSIIEVVFSAGMMTGGLVVGFWGGFKHKMYSMSLSNLLFGTGAIALGLVSSFPVYVAAMTMMGLVMPLFNIPWTVLAQTKIDPAYMGRVFGVFTMVGSLMAPAGMLIFGPLADVVSIDLLMIGSGVAIILLCIPYVSSKALLEAGRGDVEQ